MIDEIEKLKQEFYVHTGKPNVIYMNEYCIDALTKFLQQNSMWVTNVNPKVPVTKTLLTANYGDFICGMIIKHTSNPQPYVDYSITL